MIKPSPEKWWGWGWEDLVKEEKGKLYMFLTFGLSVKLKCSVHLAVSAQKPPSTLC